MGQRQQGGLARAEERNRAERERIKREHLLLFFFLAAEIGAQLLNDEGAIEGVKAEIQRVEHLRQQLLVPVELYILAPVHREGVRMT